MWARVEIKENTRVVRGHEIYPKSTSWGGAAAAHDLKIEALGVVLGPIGVSTAVEGDDLVAENVVSGGDIRRNLSCPLEAVLDEDVGGPGAGNGRVKASSFSNLEEGERPLINGIAAVIRASGEVIDDGSL